MERAEVVDTIHEAGLITILRLPSADVTLEMAEVLIEAGIACLDIPLTVPGAVDVIAELVSSFGHRALIGAGTVLDPRDAEACHKAGAHFIGSPALDAATVSWCNEAGVAAIAGALTPTEILHAWRAGADMVKVYPCNAQGGPAYLKALLAPMPQVKLIPAGGVNLQTAAQFLTAGAIAVEVGSDLCDADALRGGRTQDIITNAHLYLDVVAQARALAKPADP